MATPAPENSDLVVGLVALVGVLVGGLITSVFSWLLEKRKFRLQVTEKVLEKRIAAYETMLALSSELALMCLLDEHDFEKESERYPQIFFTCASFSEFQSRWALGTNASMHWLSNEANREINLFSDYLHNTHFYVVNGSDDLTRRLGCILRLDFINFGNSLSRILRPYFQGEIYKPMAKGFGDWVKYSTEETVRRLESTELLVRRENDILPLYNPTVHGRPD